jgi:hypothetical protein
MAADDSADEIRRRMAELRRELSTDVREVSRQARVMTDWRFYVRRFPWTMVGVAAVAGYLLIPKRKEVKVISPDPDALAEMFKKEQLKLQTPAGRKESPGLTKSLVLMGLSWAAKAGANYVGEQVRTAATKRVHESHEPARPAPTESPPTPTWPK